MTLFNFRENELLTFFLVLLRYSILFAVLPWVGDRTIPATVKVLFAWIVSIILFPVLLNTGVIDSSLASVWANSVGNLFEVVIKEVLFALILGFTAKLIFDAIAIGSHWIGNFMGFAIASSYDTHQEAQTGIVAQVQTALAMIIFLAVDGHHLMLHAVLQSYRIVSIGSFSFSHFLEKRIIQMISEVFQFGIQISAPVSISLFSINIIFGMISKSMPQINVFTISFAVTSLVGFLMIYLSVYEFKDFISVLFLKMSDWMNIVMFSIKEDR